MEVQPVAGGVVAALQASKFPTIHAVGHESGVGRIVVARLE